MADRNRNCPAACTLRHSGCFIIAAASIMAPCAGADTYFAELGNDPITEWVGVASLTEEGKGALTGELCLVRKEYIDHPALQRSIVHVPVRGARIDGKLRLNVQPVAQGPAFQANEATLERSPVDDDPDRAFESWDYGSREDFWVNDEPKRSSITQYLKLTRGSNLWREVSPFAHPDFTRVTFFANAKAEEAQDYSHYSLDVYDRLSPAKAINFEKRKLFDGLFNVGLVNIFAETGKYSALKERLDRLGHGARILNAELADCPSTPMLTSVSVPPGLEFWYTRRLQTSGLVIAAYPESLALDPAYSEAFPLASAAIMAALRNPRLDKSGKHRAIWQDLERLLKRFAQARRPGYLSSGSIVALGTPADFMFRAELSGRALAMCDANRWEKITVNATVNSFDPQRGRADMAINFSEGFVARGRQPPGDSRWQDNRLADSDLGRLQELFVGFLKGNQVTTAKCAR